jgi:1,4-alpha-glucan branching enzyme
MWYELTNKRSDEKTVSYAECHDQALVGDKSLIFRLMDKEMYYSMNMESSNPVVDRGMALIKLIRLVTIGTAGDGYLNFMGNEFGHPEWIDFPREGNGWSYAYARRQWSLADADYLRYHCLQDFDREMIHLIKRYGALAAAPELLRADEEKKILIFKRKSLIFALNFNPVDSFADYAFPAPDGDYVKVLDSDEKRFNGFSRLDDDGEHFTVDGNLILYLPSRCALVLTDRTNRK